MSVICIIAFFFKSLKTILSSSFVPYNHGHANFLNEHGIFVLPILIILEGSNPPMPVIFTFLGFYLFMIVMGWIMHLLGISDGNSNEDDDGD